MEVKEESTFWEELCKALNLNSRKKRAVTRTQAGALIATTKRMEALTKLFPGEQR